MGCVSGSTRENRELFSYGLNKRIDGVDAIDQRLIETDFGEINAELFFEENNDLDGIYRSEASADQQRSVVRERLPVTLLKEKLFEVLANFFPVVHVFSLDAQI